MKDLKGKKIKGGHVCVYQENDFVVLYTRYGVYQGFYLEESLGDILVDRERTPRPQNNHFDTLEDCLAYFGKSL